jgi:alkylation response protein AidB-like acyl-CoA dehydrogenase
MSLASTPELRDLARSVAGFAAREADTGRTRVQLDEHAAGRRTESWDRLVAQGLHAVHLPEDLGGAGGGLQELAVITEELGKALYPGPFVPTALAGAVLGVCASLERRTACVAAIEELVAGAAGALVVDPALRATRTASGWVVRGTADGVVAAAVTEDGEELWFRLRSGPGTETTDRSGTDLTRSVGCLRLTDHQPAPEDVLPTPPAATRRLVVATVLAAEAVGLGRWLLETAVEHVRTRHQFDRPIGSFQAVQHRAALMLVRSESAAAATWDAARAEAAPVDQQELAGAQAALVGPPSAVDLAVDCVSLLGAIGFTWEHDAHLYWRRAVSVLATAGPEERWARTLGSLATSTRRDFGIVADDALPTLRAEVGAVLDQAAELPDDDGATTAWGPLRGGPRRSLLAQHGLAGPHLPKPYGRAAGIEEQAVIAQEFARRGLVPPTTVIGEWVLPTILEHGTDTQRERFVAPTLRGEIVWCQLFSEPGAGSDLAGLSTRARRVDGGWSLTGQKVWNSYAHEADWGVCLARTDADAPKHAGLSYFLVDMHAPGLDVRPIRQATGKAEFNEVFLDEVFVPDEGLVGEPGAGWRLAATTLANERLNMGAALGHGSSELIRHAMSHGAVAATDDEAHRVLGRCVSREMVISALAMRANLAQLAGVDPGASVSVQKVVNALAQRDGSRDLVALLGPIGSVSDDGSPYAVDHLGLPAVLFGGGTIEIQLNVIARRVLGLPSGASGPRPKRSADA